MTDQDDQESQDDKKSLDIKIFARLAPIFELICVHVSTMKAWFVAKA